MARVSFTEVWDRTRAFVAAEGALLAPVALACFALPSLLVSIVMPQPAVLGAPPPPGAWILWLLLSLAAVLFGSLAVSAMVLVPAITVGEAIRRAASRLPAAVALLGLLLIALLASIVVLSVVAGIVAHGAGWAPPAAASFAVLVLMLAVLVAAVRLILVWASVVDGAGPIAALRRSLRLTAGLFWRLTALMMLALVVTLLLSVTAQFAGGSLLLLLGRAVGSDALGLGLAKALVAVVLGLWQMVTTVYLGFLYRALEGSSSGT